MDSLLKLSTVYENHVELCKRLEENNFLDLEEDLKGFYYEEFFNKLFDNVDKYFVIFDYSEVEIEEIKTHAEDLRTHAIEVLMTKNGLKPLKSDYIILDKYASEKPMKDKNDVINTNEFERLLQGFFNEGITFERAFNVIKVRYEIQLTEKNKIILNNLYKS